MSTALNVKQQSKLAKNIITINKRVNKWIC